jgi:hypothetical protein
MDAVAVGAQDTSNRAVNLQLNQLIGPAKWARQLSIRPRGALPGPNPGLARRSPAMRQAELQYL